MGLQLPLQPGLPHLRIKTRRDQPKSQPQTHLPRAEPDFSLPTSTVQLNPSSAVGRYTWRCFAIPSLLCPAFGEPDSLVAGDAVSGRPPVAIWALSGANVWAGLQASEPSHPVLCGVSTNKRTNGGRPSRFTCRSERASSTMADLSPFGPSRRRRQLDLGQSG